MGLVGEGGAEGGDIVVVDGVDETIRLTVYDTTTPTVNSTDNPVATHITNTGTQPIPVDTSGTSSTFTELSFISEGKILAKGVRNSLDFFPRTLGENMEGTEDIVASLDGTNTDIGQVFRLTTGTDNIVSLGFTLNTTSLDDVIIDDFESYVNEAALDSAWVQDDSINTPATLETTTVSEGTQAIKIDISKNGSKYDTVTKTFTAEDWSANRAIRLRFRNERAHGSEEKNEVEFRISDGTNTGKIKLTSSDNNVWDTLVLNFTDFTPVGVDLPDFTAITSIIFVIKKDDFTASFFIDKIERLAEDYGTVDVEIYDFGTIANPTSLGTPITLDDGTTFARFDLKPGEQDYHINLLAGIKSTALTADNYFGINITNKSNSQTIVDMKGRTSGNFYSNGFAFKSIDNGTTVTNLTSQDMGFQVFYNDECLYDGFVLVFDASPGNTIVTHFVEDRVNNKIANMIIPIEGMINRLEINHNWKLEHSKDLSISKGFELEFKISDDSSSTSTKFEVTTLYRFKKKTIHG